MMTLTEVLIQLAEIKNKVTSTSFNTNITKIDININGDWKNWNIKFHTEAETISDEEIDKLAQQYFDSDVFDGKTCVLPEVYLNQQDTVKEIFKAGYRKAKED